MTRIIVSSRGRHELSARVPFVPWVIICFFFQVVFTGPSAAHHTNRISYIFQKVGEKTIGCYAVELIATPPKWIPQKGTTINGDAYHGKLKQFSHRFQVYVRNRLNNLKAVAGKTIKLKFEHGKWTKSFSLHSFIQNGDPTYAVNAALGPRGHYSVSVAIDGFPAPGCKKNPTDGKLTPIFSFNYDYETLKQVMGAMEAVFRRLGNQTLTLGLNGKFIPPQTKEEVRKQAVYFKELVPLMTNLREGDEQKIYEDRVAKLLKIAEQIEASAQKMEYSTLTSHLADARKICANCHEIFQEADSTGIPPKIPANEK